MKSALLSDWGLEGLTRNEPTTLYHGTTTAFDHFDPGKSRNELVDEYYGSGIFLTPRKDIAWSYAYANRNAGFPPSIIEDLDKVNPNASRLLKALFQEGRNAWESYCKKNGLWDKEEDRMDYAGLVEHLGVDPDTLMDISQHIQGTAFGDKKEEDSGQELYGLLFGSSGSPSWIYDLPERVGLDSKRYRPRVLTVEVRISNPLVTADKKQARQAPQRGYDGVVFYGEGIVRGVPEVAVYNPQNVKIVGVEFDNDEED
jgi:hypothetical protein